MPSIEVSGNDLFEAVKRLPPKEFDAFLERALSLRIEPKATPLSAKETLLIKRINRGLPDELRKRYSHLIARRKKGVLTSSEYRELIDLTNETETCDVDRAAALLELAKVRRLPVRTLMKQMGIQAPAAHG